MVEEILLQLRWKHAFLATFRTPASKSAVLKRAPIGLGVGYPGSEFAAEHDGGRILPLRPILVEIGARGIRRSVEGGNRDGVQGMVQERIRNVKQAVESAM